MIKLTEKIGYGFGDMASSMYGHENEVYNSMMSFCNVND